MKHFLALPFLVISTAAFAEATPQGAATLSEVFQTYLGKTPGVVSVVADGDAYAITLDPSPLVSFAPPEAKATMVATPLLMRATENGDGTWGVTQDQALGLTLTVPGIVEMDVKAASFVCNGTFSAALKSFVQNDCKLTDMTIDQTVQDPQTGTQVSKQTVKEVTYSTTATPGQTGGVDGTMIYAGTGIAQTMQIPTGPDALPFSVEMTADRFELTSTTSGVRMDALLAAAAWAVANPSQKMMTEQRGELKTILQGGLPLFEVIDGSGSFTNVNVLTPVGPVGVASVGFDVTMKGAVADGQFREAFRLEGVTPPPGILPPFAEKLMPERFAIDFTVQRFDASAAAGLLLGLFDLAPGAEPGPEFEGQMLQALMPDGSVEVVLAPGEVANGMYSLSYQGSMTAGPMGPPTGTATVSMTGIDAVTAALGEAPDDMKSQFLPVLALARGLAKPGTDGALTWEIDASQPGSLLVNGTDLMGMQ